MTRSRFIFSIVFTLIACLARVPLASAGATPLNCDVTTPSISAFPAGPGVYGDGIGGGPGTGEYDNGTFSGFVQCFFGAAGKDFDLVTYSSTRTLHYIFASDRTTLLTLSKAGIVNPDRSADTDFSAESDFTSVNFFSHSHTFGQMAAGSTAQISAGLEFHWPTNSSPTTYELEYGCLTVTRGGAVNTPGLTSSQYLLTSHPDPIILGNVQAVPCVTDAAVLGRVRKTGGAQNIGTVHMPIQILMTLQ